MKKNKIISSIILTFIFFIITIINMNSITYAKYTFNYNINVAEIEIIV